LQTGISKAPAQREEKAVTRGPARRQTKIGVDGGRLVTDFRHVGERRARAQYTVERKGQCPSVVDGKGKATVLYCTRKQRIASR